MRIPNHNDQPADYRIAIKDAYTLRCFGQMRLEARDRILIRGPTVPLQLLLLLSVSNRSRSIDSVLRILWPGSVPAKGRRSLDQALYTLRRIAPDLVERSSGHLILQAVGLVTDLDRIDAVLRSTEVDELMELLNEELLPQGSFAQGELPQLLDGVRTGYKRRISQKLHSFMQEQQAAQEWTRIREAYRRLHRCWTCEVGITNAYIQALINSPDANTLRVDAAKAIRFCTAGSTDEIKDMRRLVNRAIRYDKQNRVPLAPLCGRHREIEQFQVALRALEKHEPFVTAICGIAGVGRSRFARHCGRIAAIGGARVITVRLTQHESHVNYSRLLQGFRRLVGSSASSPKSVLRDDALSILAHGIEHQQVPAVIIIDDLDAADESCAELLGNFQSQLRGKPIGVIMTGRLLATMRDMSKAVPPTAHYAFIELRPLAGTDYQDLLCWAGHKYRLDEDAVGRIGEVAAGNPRYTIACAKRAKFSRIGDAVPPDVALDVEQVISQMTPIARNLATAVALAPGHIHRRTLKSGLNVPEPLIRGALQWLVGMGVLVTTRDGVLQPLDHFVCLRLVQQADRPHSQELLLSLANRSIPISKINAATLFERGGDRRRAAKQYTFAASQALCVGALEDAERWALMAIGMAQTSSFGIRARYTYAEILLAQNRHADAAKQYAELCLSTEMLPKAKALVCESRQVMLAVLLDQVAPVFVADTAILFRMRDRTPSEYVAVLAAIAQTAVHCKNTAYRARAIALLEKEFAQPNPLQHWLEVALSLCKLQFYQHGFAIVLPLTDECLRRARVIGTARELANALTIRGTVLTSAGSLSDALDAFAEAKQLVAKHHLPEYRILFQNMAVVLMEMGDFDSAAVLIDELLSYHDRHAAPYYQAICYLNLATLHYESGSHDQAIIHANEALRRRSFFPTAEYGAAIAILGLIAAERNDWGHALRAADELEPLDRTFGDLSYEIVLRARTFAYRGMIPEATRLLEQSAAEVESRYIPASIRIRLESFRQAGSTAAPQAVRS